MLQAFLCVSIPLSPAWEQEGSAALPLTLKGSVMLLKHFSSCLQALCSSFSSSQPTANMLCQGGKGDSAVEQHHLHHPSDPEGTFPVHIPALPWDGDTPLG